MALLSTKRRRRRWWRSKVHGNFENGRVRTSLQVQLRNGGLRNELHLEPALVDWARTLSLGQDDSRASFHNKTRSRLVLSQKSAKKISAYSRRPRKWPSDIGDIFPIFHRQFHRTLTRNTRLRRTGNRPSLIPRKSQQPMLWISIEFFAIEIVHLLKISIENSRAQHSHSRHTKSPTYRSTVNARRANFSGDVRLGLFPCPCMTEPACKLLV